MAAPAHNTERAGLTTPTHRCYIPVTCLSRVAISSCPSATCVLPQDIPHPIPGLRRRFGGALAARGGPELHLLLPQPQRGPGQHAEHVPELVCPAALGGARACAGRGSHATRREHTAAPQAPAGTVLPSSCLCAPYQRPQVLLFNLQSSHLPAFYVSNALPPPALQGKAGEPPTAAELAAALQSHQLFVYFGHGGGDQYIPAGTLRALDSCSAALLMGCSSGRLRLRGAHYEPSGPVLAYLLAGAWVRGIGAYLRVVFVCMVVSGWVSGCSGWGGGGGAMMAKVLVLLCNALPPNKACAASLPTPPASLLPRRQRAAFFTQAAGPHCACSHHAAPWAPRRLPHRRGQPVGRD